MKTFDLNQFKKQVILSRYADNVVKELSTFDRLSKFALQHCESDLDFESLELILLDCNETIESYIKERICNEHTEIIEDSTDSSSDN